MKKYLSPFIILANGTINMTVSQLGQLGVGEETINNWNAFWEEHKDDINALSPSFDINDDQTWFNLFPFDD